MLQRSGQRRFIGERVFVGFRSAHVEVQGTSIFMTRKGRGTPVLLLHGFPETHLMWHQVAPMLAERFTVVCADLRGYGLSGKPASSPDHLPYTKRAMAQDMIELMDAVGFEQFAVLGHDRGARVAYRMALDHPDRVVRLGVLDIIPTGEAFARADRRLALGYWPWTLFAQPAPLPESVITAVPDAIVDNALRYWGSDPAVFAAAVREQYIAALRDPAAAHAICEEFRAAASADVEADDADRASNRRIECQTLVLWARGGPLDTWYEDAGGPLSIWRRWATHVQGHAIRGGHFFPEANAVETAAALESFLNDTP